MKEKINYAELGLPIFFLLVTLWYLSDAYRADSTVENLLLILPAGIVVLALCIWIMVSQLFFQPTQVEEVEEEKETKKKETEEQKEVSVLGAMIILAGYVLTMNWIGFDVATFLFIAALMFLQGERRIPMLLGFSFVFAFAVSLFFEYMIPYPMPMLIGKELIGGLL